MVQSQNQHKLIFPILTIVWILIIFSFSIQSGSISSLQSGFITSQISRFLLTLNIVVEPKTLSFLIRKLAHFTEFFILGSLVRKSSFELNRKDILYFIFIIPVIDEFIQYFVPERAMTLMDMGIDSIGILFGIGFITFVHIIFKKNNVKQ
ncbi:MAG: VanZ family protein [Ignavibacteria bacterium]|nr:VanZ family protein [Ignavibacteria bacterium]